MRFSFPDELLDRVITSELEDHDYASITGCKSNVDECFRFSHSADPLFKNLGFLNLEF